LAATVNATVPLPVWLPPFVIVIHASLLDAAQAQPALVVTAIGFPAPPFGSAASLAGLTAYEQPACVTANGWPAIVIEALRALPELAATTKLALPLPVPLALFVKVIHGTPLADVQAQPSEVATATGPPAPPSIGNDWLFGLIEKAHAPLCVTVKVCPATVSVPVRAAPVFAATVKATLPLPLPDAAPVMLIQDALLAADQPQPPVAVTATAAPAPPAAEMDWLVGLIVMAHGAA
jgi:hypothetical protein